MNKIKKSYEQIQTVISERTCKWNFLVSKKKEKEKEKKRKEKKKKTGTARDVTPQQWL